MAEESAEPEAAALARSVEDLREEGLGEADRLFVEEARHQRQEAVADRMESEADLEVRMGSVLPGQRTGWERPGEEPAC